MFLEEKKALLALDHVTLLSMLPDVLLTAIVF